MNDTASADYRLQFHPPKFKGEDEYLTAEGYPLGTTCWYVTVEAFGIVKLCCGATPHEAFFAATYFAEGELRRFATREDERLKRR